MSSLPFVRVVLVHGSAGTVRDCRSCAGSGMAVSASDAPTELRGKFLLPASLSLPSPIQRF